MGIGYIVFAGGYTGSGKISGRFLPDYTIMPGMYKFIAGQMSPEGEVEWVIHAGGMLSSIANDFITDDSGNVYLTGDANVPVDFGNNITFEHTGGGSKSFLLKPDRHKTPQWIVPFAGDTTGQTEIYDINCLPGGYIGITGRFNSPLQVGDELWGPVPDTGNAVNGFVLVINSNGGIVDKVTFLGQSASRGNGDFIMRTCFNKINTTLNIHPEEIQSPAISLYTNPAER